MGIPKFLKAVWSVETLFGGIILGAAIWSAFTYDDEIAGVAKAAFSAKDQAAVAQTEVAVAQQNIEHVEGRVSEIETKMEEQQRPTVVVRQVNETPFRNDAALLERARRVRDAQRQADANR